MLTGVDLPRRARAAAWHLAISLTIAAAAAVLVFLLWYPGAFRLMAGGRELFLLVTVVDVVIGPLLTFAVFNVAKGSKVLRRDLAVIVSLQTAALAYGLHTVYLARPVAMVFEVDRFRLVTAVDVPADDLAQAPKPYQRLSVAGPVLLGTRAAHDSAEHLDALWTALDGVDIGFRPQFWQPYEQSRSAAVAHSRPVAVLIEHYPLRGEELQAQLRELGANEASDRFVPATARGDWVAVLDKNGGVRGYVPFDGFF